MPANGTSLAGVAVPFRISLSSYPSSRQRSDHDAVRKLDVFVVMYKTHQKWALALHSDVTARPGPTPKWASASPVWGLNF